MTNTFLDLEVGHGISEIEDSLLGGTEAYEKVRAYFRSREFGRIEAEFLSFITTDRLRASNSL